MRDRNSLTVLQIQTERDLKKLAAFLRVKGRDVRFDVARDMVERALAWLDEFAAAHPWTIVVEVIRPEGLTLRRFVVGGAAVGAAVGLSVGGIPGAVVGAGAGALSGAVIAHVRVTVNFEPGGEAASLVLSLAAVCWRQGMGVTSCPDAYPGGERWRIRASTSSRRSS
jgi:hypothetical protein